MNRSGVPSIDCVEKEECSLCFEDVDSPGGVCVCLTCLQCFCAYRRHAELHTRKTKHQVFANLRRAPLAEADRLEQSTLVQAQKDAAEAERGTTATLAPQVLRTSEGYTIQGAESLEAPVPPVRLEGIYDVAAKCWVACLREPEAGSARNWSSDLRSGAYPASQVEAWITLAESVHEAAAMSRKEQVQAWELQLQPCEHTLTVCRLEGIDVDTSLSRSTAKCSSCDLRENLWLCLSCGHLGCGRTNFDGTGGKNHAWEHFQAYGGMNADHAVAVKLGTITADGTADVHCYVCDELRVDPELERHLSEFGIDIRREEKTEKSLIELEIEQNVQLNLKELGSNFSDHNPSLRRITDPSLYAPDVVATGMRNMGNTCYISSVLQCIYALVFAPYRWYQEPRALSFPFKNKSLDRHYTRCEAGSAVQCFECQMRKLADGLLSQRYWKREHTPQRIDELGRASAANIHEHEHATMPKPVKTGAPDHEAPSRMAEAPEPEPAPATSDVQTPAEGAGLLRRYQPPQGIAPRMFQNLIGQGHPEFATKRQQDAHEFLEYFLSRCTAEARRQGTRDPARFFTFPLVQRTECLRCHRIGMNSTEATSLYVPIASSVRGAEYSTRSKAISAEQDQESSARVSLAACLDLSVASELLSFQCPSCRASIGVADPNQAERRESPSRCPPFLIMHLRRFEAGEDWVPRKVSTAVTFSDPQRGLEQRADGTIVLDMKPWLVVDESEWDRLPPERRMEAAEAPASGTPSGRALTRIDPSERLLMDMGFTLQQARVALQASNHDGERAIEWLLDSANSAAANGASTPEEEPTANTEAETSAALASSSRTRYALAAAMVHLGASLQTGHYVAYVYRNKRWLLYNDEKVFDAGQNPSALEQAFVLIWRRDDEAFDATCVDWMTSDRLRLESDTVVSRVQPLHPVATSMDQPLRFDGTVLNWNTTRGASANEAAAAPTFSFAEQLDQLMSMGFSADASRQALEASRGDVEQALNMLLSA
jgi:ubiquitin carboxyl-terminal hydrolase 5/13